VSLQQIAALLRRHLIAVLLVVLAAGMTFYALRHTPVSYQESATVLFVAPPSTQNPDPYAVPSNSLISAGGLLAVQLMSAQSQQQVSAAGGTGTYQVALVNLYDEEYPSFGDPDDTITVTAYSPTGAHQTFLLVTGLLDRDLRLWQESKHVPKVDWAGAVLAGDSGPLSEQGSTKRVYVGLLILTILTVLSVANFLDRHPVRLGRSHGLRLTRGFEQPRLPLRPDRGAR
jgi:hypothetical protein